jgi:lipoprotein-anchoring transpeptidase ErfK/SrfK
MRRVIDICIATQILQIIEQNKVLKSYPISSAKNGLGEAMGSECTPRGKHKIRAKIGANQPLNSVFIGRRPTGEIYSPELAAKFPKRDWILTRILWLGGLEPGFNRYGNKDSTWRYIYIHGCPDHLMQGLPDSHGCIRMGSQDIVDFFEQSQVGDEVFIHP